MKNKLILVLCALNIPATIWAILQSPNDQVAIHFNAVGEADRYGSKWVYLIFAFLPLVITLLYPIYRKSDKNNPNAEKNRRYEEFLIPLLAFFFIVIGWVFSAPVLLMSREQLNAEVLSLIPLAISVLFAGICCIMPKVKYNHTFGLRVPWTLNSETVWRKTHRMMGYTGLIGALLSTLICIVALCIGQPMLSIFGIIFLILGGVIVPILYAVKLSKEESK